MTTKKLNNGRTVLAESTKKYGVSAKQYVNYAQANKKASELQAQGITCQVIGLRPFYVQIFA